MLETRIRELVKDGRMIDAKELMGVVECFAYPKARMLRTWLMRELKGCGVEREDVSEKVWYVVFSQGDGAEVLVGV